jgi:cation diffusion facilitator CzcD-associated flavoprotein CzcO
MPIASAKPAPKDTPRDAIVIGAGFAGLYQMHLLRDRLGLDVIGLEAATTVGGTWYWNRYPGARCDSESHAYCYTFSKDLYRSWTWSERYPGQAEILSYLEHVAAKLDLKRSFRFDTRVTSAAYDEATALWHVETERGQRHTARYLIAAVGCLSTANIPDIPGRDSFLGSAYHTGTWPHEGVDVAGARVGMIGTGSTGIQAAPVLAETAKHLTVFQRTANYSVPARNAPLADSFKSDVHDQLAAIRATTHTAQNGHPFLIEDRSAFDVSAEQREALYEAAWQKGGLQFRAHFRDILTDEAANATAADFIKRKIRGIVTDPATAELLADIDHPFSAKRPPIDTNYFETFNRPNVSLIDVRRDPLEAITPTGLVLRSGASHDLDVIVYATGFDAMTGPLLRLNLTGRNGQPLSAVWAAGARTYLGLQIAGFPNLFTITGPGSPSVLTNMPVAVEQHAEWIADCIAAQMRDGKSTIEAEPSAVDAWVGEVNAVAETSLLSKVPHSWYLGANIPGKPRVFMPYVGGMPRYRRLCADIATEGYRGFVRT